MYANLEVRIRRDSDPTTDEVLSAWRVSIIGATATVFLDDPDEEGHAPAGERVVDLGTHAMTIAANF